MPGRSSPRRSSARPWPTTVSSSTTISTVVTDTSGSPRQVLHWRMRTMADSPGSKYQYKRLFDPDALLEARQTEAAASSAAPLSADRSDPYSYVYDNEDLVLAINVALATRRPLLVRGLPGSGKSSLAISIARL